MSNKSSGNDGSNGLLVTAVSTVGALAAATIARKALRLGWKAVVGEPPPDDPKSRDTDWVVALSWAIASGAAIGVARLIAERQVAGRLVESQK